MIQFLDLVDLAELVSDVLVPVEVPNVDAEGVVVDPVHVQDELLVPLGRQRPSLVLRTFVKLLKSLFLTTIVFMSWEKQVSLF